MVSEFYYICTLQVFYWRPDQCDRSKLFDAQYMNEWLSHKLNDRQRASAVRYMTDNGHFTPQYEFIFAPHEVRMLDYVLKMDGETLSEDFHKLMRAFGHDKVKLKKTNSLGAAARSDSKTRLDVDHLNVGALLSIHAMYPHDVSLGNYPLRRLMH